jgi:hypothetical protein
MSALGDAAYVHPAALVRLGVLLPHSGAELADARSDPKDRRGKVAVVARAGGVLDLEHAQVAVHELRDGRLRARIAAVVDLGKESRAAFSPASLRPPRAG